MADAERHEAFTLVEGGVRHPEDLRRVADAADGPFDVVVHLAALAGVRPSIADPVRYESVIVGGTQ